MGTDDDGGAHLLVAICSTGIGSDMDKVPDPIEFLGHVAIGVTRFQWPVSGQN